MNQVQDSTREKQERTTQYMSHGVSRAGSEVRRALYEAKIGKRNVIIELNKSSSGQLSKIFLSVLGAMDCRRLTKGGWELCQT